MSSKGFLDMYYCFRVSSCLETGFAVSQLTSRCKGRVGLIFIRPVQGGIEVVKKLVKT